MGLSRLLPFASLAFLATSVAGQPAWTSDPALPPAVPLAVRSPYLSAWLPQGAGTSLTGTWPTFWTGSFLGWTGYVSVDGTAYNWMGAPAVPNLSPANATQKSMSYTSTQSTFVLSAGPVDLTINFLSPVEPTDLVKLGTPFSYMAISAAANDGGSHNVSIYSDITAEWAVGDTTQLVNWTSTTTGDVWTHQVGPSAPILYTEFNDHTHRLVLATGYTDNSTGVENQPVEESGNMLIMILSYTQATNDTSLIKPYISALETWTDYLVGNALTPGGQLSTDDFEPFPDTAGNFSTFIVQTATDAGGQHLNFNYGNSSSWLSAYNLWADKLIKTNVFPQDVIDKETAWYKTQVGQYGLALDSREPWSKTDWELWTAAFVSDTDVRNSIIDGQFAYITSGAAGNIFPFSDLYDTGAGTAHDLNLVSPAGSGITYQFQARPVVGGHLALLVA
ncbi:DUF1793-domain-containing protein [Coniophora puteana RWD-64-598 SS2]|uniref:DUF1793-domain-containing protein n=1 Tax=Coniophora puteana (strain RWD-64-598) TaxID=741705 RepID=A0A5M3MYD5_CONPW|nr:DUF1793-domain-containing protein [Coniophora puteana RWD-64-598 SS2]EIW84037.1 DUF1793-domain-containing protein [Coniophora puteana RWD-64-598 SS2]